MEDQLICLYDLVPRKPLWIGVGNCHYLIFLDKETKAQKN